MYNLPKWNIIYDLGNGDGFWTDSGLNEYCKGKLNNSWFILNKDNENNKYLFKQQSSSYTKTPLIYLSYNDILLVIFCLLSSICCGIYFVTRYKKLNGYDKIGNDQKKQYQNKYGSMRTIYIS